MLQPGRWSRAIAPFTWLISVAVVVVLLADAVAFLAVRADSYYVFSPGTAPLITTSTHCRDRGGGALSLPDGTPCARLDVPSRLVHPIHGALFMVDVLVGPATPLDYLRSKLGALGGLGEGFQLLPKGEVLGDTPPSQLGCQDAQQMQGSTLFAAVAAVRRLGYQVLQHDQGARLFQVQPGSPAARAGLRCGDLVTAVDRAAVRTSEDLVGAIQHHRPGDRITITVVRIQGGRSRSLQLVAHLSGTPALFGHPADPRRAFLGVVAEDDVTYSLPFGLSVDVGDIGGPSAGLALTLGFIDALSSGQLTGGRRVAATGTISPDGQVGDVSGVAQKAIAVRRAGAQVFFVPPQEYRAALRQAGPMKVYPVSSLTQALADLQALGGRVPPPPGGQNIAG